MPLVVPAVRVRGVAFLLASCLWLTGAGRASAATLADLDCLTNVACQSFDAGGLHFDDFDVIVSGDLDRDPTAYAVSLLPDGFRLSGPIHASAREFGDIVLTYDLSSSLPGVGIGQAVLSFVAGAAGNGALAAVSEDFLTDGPDPIASLFVAVSTGVSILSDSMIFNPALGKLHVIKDILVIGREGGLHRLGRPDVPDLRRP
jgi:hypothetical protein